MNMHSNIIILRWRGGEGGDTLLKMLVGSNPNFCSNIQWSGIDVNGKTGLIEDNIKGHFVGLPSAVNIAIGDRHNSVTFDQLVEDISKLRSLPSTCILKSHWYKSSIFNDITIDLVASNEMLPFVVNALIEKNKKTIQNYNDVRSKIKDPNVLKAYDLYSVSWDRIHSTVEYSNNQINVESLLNGWDILKSKLAEFDLLLDDQYKPYYADWMDKNQKYMPSAQYKKLVNTSNFDYKDPHISLTERYCLLAMAKKSFTVLTQ